jgi:hypothetical protein
MNKVISWSLAVLVVFSAAVTAQAGHHQFSDRLVQIKRPACRWHRQATSYLTAVV